VRRDAVRVLGQDAVPRIRVPQIIPQIDAQNYAVGIDSTGYRDARMPGKAVEQLGKSDPVALQFFLGQTGIVLRRETEVAYKTPLPAVDAIKVCKHAGVNFTFAQQFVWRPAGFEVRRPRVNPALE